MTNSNGANDRIVVYGNTKDGQLTIKDRKRLDKWLAAKDGECRVEVIRGSRRSLAFVAYYFGACKELAKQTGHDHAEEIHEMNKRDFNDGLTTSDLTDTQFGEFVERCKRGWAIRGHHVADEYWKG